MAYENFLSNGRIIPSGTGVLGVEDLDGSPAVHGEYLVLKKCFLKRIMFYTTEAVVSTSAPPQVRFSKRITPGSDTGAVVAGSLLIPDATAIGKVIYKDVTPLELNVGDTIKLENTVQTVGGSTTGQGFYGFELDDSPEDARNEGDSIKSA